MKRRHCVQSVLVQRLTQAQTASVCIYRGSCRKLRGVAYLCGREPDDAGQVFPLGGRQVPLLPEPSLQFVCLCLGEQNPPLAFLGASRLNGTLAPRLVLSFRLWIVFLGVQQVVLAVLSHEGRPHKG